MKPLIPILIVATTSLAVASVRFAQRASAEHERAQVGELREQLDDSGAPLSEDQRSQMLAAMLEEKQRQPRPTPVEGASREDTIAQQNQWQEEYERNVSERAKQVLTADQYEAYREYLEWNADMRKTIERRPAGPAGAALSIQPVARAAR